MITGIRADAQTAVRAGMKYIQFSVKPEEVALAIDKYLTSLQPVESPWLEEGKFSQEALQGQKIFNKAGCVNCHSGPYYTNQKMYNVGTGTGREKDVKFDTPTLIEIWRTAPYLYDGRAENMEEVFTDYNTNDQHGETSQLNKQELSDLIEFINSL